MSLALPLGLFALLSIVALIIIYIIKPNYQQKIVSSTLVWRLSLKYRRRRVPVSKLRNIILFIIQVLILALCSTIIAKPLILAEASEEYAEAIMVIDASVGMRLADSNGVTRFERAVDEVYEEVNSVLSQDDGVVTIIVAGQEAEYFLDRSRMTADNKAEILTALDEMKIGEDLDCSYGKGDLEGAMELVEKTLLSNPKARVLLYTARDSESGHIYRDRGTVVDVSSEEAEWNAAILSSRVEKIDNYYIFYAEVACYGAARELTVNCEITQEEAIFNMNPITFYSETDMLTDEAYVYELEFRYAGSDGDNYVVGQEPEGESEGRVKTGSITEYISAHIYITTPQGDNVDNFGYDNDVYLYGGTRPEIKIQYVSSVRNPFLEGFLLTLQDVMQNSGVWEINYVSIPTGGAQSNYPLEGYDYYIFENVVPKEMPIDGAVLLINPSSVPVGLGVTIGHEFTADVANPANLAASDVISPITQYMKPNRIMLTRFFQITDTGDFSVLLTIEQTGDPALLYKNTVSEKIAILPFSLQYSDFSVWTDFPVFMMSLFNEFIPATLEGHLYEIGEEVKINSRSATVKVVNENYGSIDGEKSYDSFPVTVSFDRVGTYSVLQTPISGQEIRDNLFVKIPTSESDVTQKLEIETNPFVLQIEEKKDTDLLVYFAAALVALLFAEWWLQIKDHF